MDYGKDATMSADASLVFDLATAFWRSSVLFAACELGLFDVLCDGPATAVTIMEKLKASERGMYALLESCVTLGLLERKGDVYGNTETSEQFLTHGGSESLLATLRMQSATYPMWMKLKDAVISGEPVMPPSEMLGRNKELTRHFVVGMHQRALGVAKAMVAELDLSGAKRLADVGGGPGTYSVMLAQRHPELRADILDLAPILEVSRELIDQSDVGDRIKTLPFNAETDSISGTYDVVLISGLLHRMSAEQCVAILMKAYKALSAGGQVIVNDLMSIDDGPEMAVLFGLQMLLINNTGGTHRVDDMTELVKKAGFSRITVKTLPPPLPHSLVMGCKE